MVLGPVWTSLLWTGPEPPKTMSMALNLVISMVLNPIMSTVLHLIMSMALNLVTSMVVNLVKGYLKMLFSCFGVLLKVIAINQGNPKIVLHK